jgi:hypothetical protein
MFYRLRFRRSLVGVDGSFLYAREQHIAGTTYATDAVVDRVTGRYPNISSFKALRRLGNLTISHSVPCATVRYTSCADISGRKLPTRKNRSVDP